MGTRLPARKKATVRLVLVGLYLLIAVSVAIAAPQPEGKPAKPPAHLDPTALLSDLLPEAAQIGMAVAVVPDPRVPRYRRSYDLDLVAIELGMLKNGYVLDRFYLPWNDGTDASDVKWGSYGVMIFRYDSWRAVSWKAQPAAVGGSRFRVLYMVTDTSTRGVESTALRNVIDRIEWQFSKGTVGKLQLLAYPGACTSDASSSTLVVLGPTFSGSLDSVGSVTDQVVKHESASGSRIANFCVVSPSVNDATNDRVVLRYNNLSFMSLALDENRKLGDLAGLLVHLVGSNPGRSLQDQVAAASSRVAILAEASTFGYGICIPGVDHEEPLAQALCRSAKLIYFPANIADIRYGLHQQQSAQQVRTNSLLHLFGSDNHLPLQLGAENGSEFPDSRQSALTSVSAELALDQVLGLLKSLDPQPRVVIVVATDVRDRLFLFDALRTKVPRAMLVDLEADNLLGHPDFLHSSRGALAISATRLTEDGTLYGCEQADAPRAQQTSHRRPIFTWSSDVQALFADAVKGLSDQPSPAGNPSGRSDPVSCLLQRNQAFGVRQATLHVVTLQGFQHVSSGYAPRPTPQIETQSARSPASNASPASIGQVEAAEFGAPALCLVGALLWISPLMPATRRRERIWAWMDNRVVAAFGILTVYAVFLVYVAGNLRRVDYDNPVVYWIAAGAAGGLAGLFVCTRVLNLSQEAAPPRDYRNTLLPAFLALWATLMSLTPVWWLYQAPATYGRFADVQSLMMLAVDPGPGMAFVLVIALATLVLLYTSVVLSTSAAVVSRNSTMLRLAQYQTEHPVETGNSNQLGRHRGIPNINPYNLLGGAAILIGVVAGPDLISGNVRLTIFGRWISFTALIALLATTISAALLASSAIGAARRITAMSRYLGIDPIPKGDNPWPTDPLTPRIFPATPLIAMLRDGGRHAITHGRTNDLTNWTSLLQGWRENQRSGKHRVAVFALLATEISVYRWSVVGAALCALASIGAVYLFPIEADQLILLNLLLLAGLGLAAGFTAISFARDPVLCSILCNREAQQRFSTPLFLFIALPFVALAVAFAIADVPGVVDWGGGVVQLLGAVGIHP